MDRKYESPAQSRDVLFQPLRLNDALTLSNRILLAPCTRYRMTGDYLPTAGTRDYYAARAQAGLLVSEGIITARDTQAAFDTPGLWHDGQVAAWATVTDAVHARGGRIFAQLWNAGRSAHSYFTGVAPRSASAVLDPGIKRGTGGIPLALEMPSAMTGAEVRQAIAQFGTAARNAKAAGFDGVEIHGANGYLPEQFWRFHTNRRTDEWGGSTEKRARFFLEVVDACAEGFGGYERVGVRISPAAYFAEMRYTPGDNDTLNLIVAKLNEKPLPYIHSSVVEDVVYDHLGCTSAEYLRPPCTRPLVGNGGYTPDAAAAHIAAGRFDLIAFGKLFIANADLVERIRDRRPLLPYTREVLDTLE